MLILRDVGLRSVLAAHFGIAGEAVVSGVPGEPTVRAALAGAEIVLIDDATLRGPPPLWAEPFADLLALSRTVVLGPAPSTPPGEPDAAPSLSRIALADPRAVVASVRARLGRSGN